MVFLYLHVSLPLSLSSSVLLLSVLVLLANLSSSFYLFDFCTLSWVSFMYILPCLYLCVCTLLYHAIVFASVYTCEYIHYTGLSATPVTSSQPGAGQAGLPLNLFIPTCQPSFPMMAMVVMMVVVAFQCLGGQSWW